MEGFDKFMPNNRNEQGLVQAVEQAQARQADRWWDQILMPDEVRAAPPRDQIFVVRGAPVQMQWGVKKTMTQPKPELHGKELFDRILGDLKEIYDVDFVIAGGAARDLHMGCTETSPDVDIFIPLPYTKFMERFNELGWKGAPVKTPVQPYNKGKDWDNSERASFNYKGSRLDLVFVGKPLTPAMVQSFPIHAQRCVYTLEGGLNVSPEALVDLTSKKFTISPTITDKDIIKNLTAKIMSWKKRPAYKDFKVGLPRGKEWWMKVNQDYQTKGKVK